MPERTLRIILIKRFIYHILHWETWPWILKYIPMVPFWIAHCVRAKSVWFFSAANPTLTFGGFEGETKTEMYARLPKGTFPKTFLIDPALPVTVPKDVISSGELSFPVAVKPDAGRMGLMFRKITSMNELCQYHETMQSGYLLQEYIDYPIEVSVFYYRFPGEQRGKITGFVKKECLSVTGDGTTNLLELMKQYPRVWFRMNEMRTRHADRLETIIPKGERFILSDALNLSRGGKLVSLETEKDDNLLNVFDKLSEHGQFYYGRYDIKCVSIDALKAGTGFSILEFNGSGAEPHHVYGRCNSLSEAIITLLDHWDVLYKISLENHRRGVRFWKFNEGLAHLNKARHNIKILKNLESKKTNSLNRIQHRDQLITARAATLSSASTLSNTNASI